MAKADIDVTPIFMKCPIPPDIVVFGMQELDMSAESLLRQETSKAQPWIEHLERQLNEASEQIFQRLFGTTLPDDEKYELIQAKQLCGVLLTLYIKKKHVPFVKDVVTGVRVTGILGMMANKGGIATRFQLHDSTFCIINAHFNAHQTNVSRRNQDYRDICAMLFPMHSGGKLTIFDHDNLFWIGDLNYRIDLPDEVVREKIKNSQWTHLAYADQLNVQIRSGNVFNGWTEAQIKFAPTYKYVPGTTEYDTEKGRIPAWCDRILWRKNASIRNTYYDRHEILQSDHRPVSGHFLVATKSIIKEKKNIVLQEIMKEVDKRHNEMIPDAVLSTSECDFGDVLYEVPVTRTIMIENVGKVQCDWKFIPKLSDVSAHKEWISVIPMTGTLMPGEKTPISITVNINRNNLASLEDISPVRDILVIQLTRGKDYYISVSANFIKESVDEGDI